MGWDDTAEKLRQLESGYIGEPRLKDVPRSWDAVSKLDNLEQGYTTGSYFSRSWEKLRVKQEKLRSVSEITVRTLLKPILCQMPYAEFLKTRYWDELRFFVLRKRGPQCEECRGIFEKLELHHITYEHRGLEIEHLEDVQLLCDSCHEAKHK